MWNEVPILPFGVTGYERLSQKDPCGKIATIKTKSAFANWDRESTKVEDTRKGVDLAIVGANSDRRESP